ncbi:MAG: isoprenylcysteine carboxylmethyltransferase family protein [bacterium]
MSEVPPEQNAGIWRKLTSTRWRVAWGYLGAVLLLVLARPTPGSLLAGLPLVAAGEAIRIVANGTLVKDKELTNRGIYAHIRHPLYVGSSLIGAGFIIMARDLVLTVVMILLFAALYRRQIHREEEKMEAFFGEDYLHWARRVPRFFPRRFRPGEIAAHFTFRKAWANREHEGVLGAAAVTAVLWVKYLLSG